MAAHRTTVHGKPWEQLFPLPMLDVQGDFRNQPQNQFARLTGVDGRSIRKLRRFPGFKDITVRDDLHIIGSGNYFGGLSGLKFIKPFAIQQAPTSTLVMRGFLVLVNDGTQDHLRIVYWYPGVSPYPKAEILLSAGGSRRFNHLDMSCDHQLLFIVGEVALPTGDPLKIEKFSRYCGTTDGWKIYDWRSETDSVEAAVGTYEGTPGYTSPFHLVSGAEYGIAYRMVYPDQGIFGPVTRPAILKVGGQSGTRSFCVLFGPSSGTPASTLITDAIVERLSFDLASRAVLQVFRTVASTNSTIPDELRGILYLESEWEIPRVTGGLQATTNCIFVGNPVIKITSSSTLPAGIVAGDAVYVLCKDETYNIDVPYRMVPFRRTVTSVTATELYFTPPVPTSLTGSSAAFYISRTGDEASTIGDPNKAYVQIRIGWDVRLEQKFFDAPTGLSDDALVRQPSLAPDEMGLFRKGNPRAKLVEEYDGLFIRVCPPGRGEDVGGQDVVRWEFVDKMRKGLIPALNFHRMPDLAERVVSLVRCGSSLAAVLNNAVLRIYRSGSKIAIDTIHNRHGSGGRWGAVGVGSTLYMTSPVGVLVVDMYSGQMDVLNATYPFFSETGRWKNHLADLQAAYDSEIGAVLFLNPTLREALVIWLNHGVLTHLQDLPYDFVTTGVELTSPDKKRAIFFNSSVASGTKTGGFFTINSDFSADTRSTLSYTDATPMTLNGTFTSVDNGAKTVTDSAATFHACMVGHYIRIRLMTGLIGTWTRAKITAVDVVNHKLTLDTGIGVIGSRYAIGGIPFRVATWPLTGEPDQPLLDLFRLKKTTAMAAVAVDLAGDTGAGNPNKLLEYQTYHRSLDTIAQRVEGTMSGSLTQPNYVPIPDQDTIIVPGLEQWASNFDFSLLGLIVHGTIEPSQKDA